HAVARGVRVAVAEDGAPHRAGGDAVGEALLGGLLQIGHGSWGLLSFLRVAGELEVRAGLGPLAQLLAELHRLVDQDLPVVGADDLHALQRAGRRALEVGAVAPEAGAVAGALELVLRAQPARRA